jgi:hypothetical protein
MIWISLAAAGFTDTSNGPLLNGNARRAGHAVGDFDNDGEWDFVYSEGQPGEESTPSRTILRFHDDSEVVIR